MLNIVFGRDNCEDPGYILDPRIYFTKHKKPEWFENDFVKRFLKEIDGSEVLFEEGLIRHKGKILGEYDFDDLFMEWCVKDRYT